MKRRQKGTGTIIKMGDTYYGRITRHGKVQVVKLSKNAREADSLWKEWLLAHPTTKKVDSVKHSLDDAWARSEEAYKVRASNRSQFISYLRYFKRFKAWMLNLGKTCLEDISTADIADYIEAETAQQSKCTKKNHLYMIRDLWEYSMPDSPNPTKGIKIRVTTQSIPREPLTDEEVTKLIEVASNYRYFPKEMRGVILVGLYTGMRRTDCVHLKAENVKDGTISANPQKTMQKGIAVRIPLHPVLKAELESTGITNGYYFPNLVKMADHNVGTALTWHLSRIFNSVVKTTTTQEGRKRKVPIKGFHALRATFITRLAERGVSLPIMESLAGHLNPQMTLHYTHPDEEVKKVAVNILPDFENGSEDDKAVFVHPEVQKVVDVCKRQIEETIEKILGRKVEVKIQAQDILGGSEAFFNL